MQRGNMNVKSTESIERFVVGLPVQVNVSILIMIAVQYLSPLSQIYVTEQASMITLRPTEAGDDANITC